MSEAFDTEDRVHRLAEADDELDPLLVQWVRFRPMFAEAMGDGLWTLEDLEQKIAHKRAFFFPGRNAAIVTELQVYPGGTKVMQSLWACGDVAEVVQMVPGIEAIARMMGCSHFLVEGRSAWKKLLAPIGFKPWSVTIAKEL